jgi:signal transduction histidine kinase/CheY-like chemotaxis protein
MTPSQVELSQVRRAASSVDSELDLMLALSEHVVAEPSLDELLRRLCAFAAELIDAELMLVPMLNDARDTYEYVAATGVDAELAVGSSLPITTGLCGWVLRHRQPVLHGQGHDLPFGERRSWEPGMHSSLLVPLLSRGEIIGGLSGVGKRGGGSFNERDLKLLTLFANHTSVALSNAQATAREQAAKQQLVIAKQRAEQQARDLAAALEAKTRLEDELLHAQKMESMGRLAGAISHDFNNILMAISCSVELAEFELAELALAEPGLSTNSLSELLASAAQAAARAAELTQQLLAFARRQVVKPQLMSLAQSIDEAGNMLRRVLPPGIELRCEAAPDLRPVFAAPGQLSQVLLNLVLNARDALPRGGLIHVRAYNRSIAAGELSSPDGAVSEGEYVVLAIEDDGTGIAPELMPRLFEPFVTTKGAGKGTGLGLATCYGIVKQLGGAIRVESELGVGTRFELLFPRTFEQVGPSEVPCVTGELPRKTIWVVDDDAAVRNMISAALTKQGHTVYTSSDGASALVDLSATPVEVELLITDILMPGLDGLQLVERLGDRHPGMKVLFVSGYPDEHHQELMDGGRHFLHKPFRPQQLAEQLLRMYS